MKLRVILAAALLVGACSDDKNETPKKSAGEACAVDSECASGLLCRNDVCVTQSNTGCDTDCGDAGSDATTNNVTNNTVVTDEDFYVSYLLQSALDNSVDLKLTDTKTGETITVNPDDVDCLRGCWLNESMTKFYSLATNVDSPGTFNILASAVDMDKKATGSATPVATAVRGVELVGDGMLYIKANGEQNVAYYLDAAGNEIEVGVIGGAQTTEGDAMVDARSEQTVVYNATLQTLDISVGSLGTPISAADKIYTIDSQNYQEVSGSYFGGNVPSAISRDGKRLAVLTTKAPLNTNACTDASQCTGPGERCGRFGRCAAIQLAVHFIDLEKTENLGQPCSGDDACGPVHICDIPSDTQLDKAVCAPRRVALGLPGQQQQGTPPRPGCELTAGRDDLYFTDVRGPLTFGPDGGLYVVGARDCSELNMPDSGIIRLAPTSDTYTVVFGKEGLNFDDAKCYNAAEQTPDDQNCIVYVSSATLSPAGNAFAFMATNPLVVEPSLADSTLDVWTVRRDGTERRWIGDNSELRTVTALRVHPR